MSNMSPGEWIQLAIFFVLGITLVLLWRQTKIQNRLFDAQILKDRYDIYWNTYEPISSEQVEDFKLYPDEYIQYERYENEYKNNDKEIRKYLSMLKYYDSLIFLQKLKELKIPDPFGDHWAKMWVKDLWKEKEFRYIHEYVLDYHPDLKKFIDECGCKMGEIKEPYGYELIMDLHECDTSKFNRESLKEFFIGLCKVIKMQRCELYFWDDVGVPVEERQTSPQTKGTSAVQFILTSNIVVHTLDELKSVYVNIFSCKHFDENIAKDFTEKWFFAKRCISHFIKRTRGT